ncbi:MAG: hypothetical protein ACYDGS_01755 [Thermoleophilia bacterium]
MSNLALTLIIIAASSLAIYLALMSGKRYKHHDAEAHATGYTGGVKEGHGPLTLFLYIAFAAVLLFTIVYLVERRSDFTSAGSEPARAVNQQGQGWR